MTLFRTKRHRLDAELYIGGQAVSFTICERNKKKVFNDREIFSPLADKLIETSREYECDLHIFLFMPDHLHLVLQSKDELVNVLTVVDKFKQKSGFWFHQNNNDVRWQKSYHDHIIRDDADIETHIYYILNNPVRAGIVKNWKEYYFKGSTIYNFDEWD